MTTTSRTVLITGAAGNLGMAVAQVFAQQGAQLVLLDRALMSQATMAALQPAPCLPIALDLCDAAQVAAAVEQALARFGRIDVLCNLTGGFAMGDAVHATSDSTWDFLHDINVRTLRNTCHAAVPHMLRQGGGKIVNVGAFSAQRGLADMGAYIAAKSAVLRITEAMSAELRMKNINVNCVLPTILDTPQNRADMPEADPTRWVSPHDLARVIAFLASDAARAIHGAGLPVTGLS
jgi:NAD(P)-dependent dehydrogenase (short-subunit alcohol dehydrogenase family)